MCFTSKPVETIEVAEQDAIVGYRNYDIGKGRLWPINFYAKPVEKVAEAECRDAGLNPVHDADASAPQQDCTCGIYVCAQNGGSAMAMNRGLVRARVRIWGRIVRHGDEGYRAQFCQILALHFQGCSSGTGCATCKELQRENGVQVSEHYGAPWVSDVKALEVAS